MSVFALFKSRIASSNYLYKNGKAASFVNGRYMTDQPAEIDELMEEIKAGNPFIYIDENEKEVDSDVKDPLSALKDKLRAEMMAELGMTPKDIGPDTMGTTDDAAASKLGVTSSANIAGMLDGLSAPATK